MARETRSVTALREYFGHAAPALESSQPLTRAGELVLTPGQKQALLVLRDNEIARAIIAALKKRGEFVAHGRDFYALGRAGLAINKGSFHVLSPLGRWKADDVVRQYVRDLKLHILMHHYGINPFVRCSCGYSRHVSARGTDVTLTLGRAAARHLLEASV